MSFGDHLVVDGEVALVRMFSSIGKRMYRHTLSFLITYASQKLFPSRRLVIGHALGDGLYFTYDGIFTLKKEDVTELSNMLTSIVNEMSAIRLYLVSYHQALEYFDKMGFLATKKLLSYRNDPYLSLYACNDFIDISYEPLLPLISSLSYLENASIW